MTNVTLARYTRIGRTVWQVSVGMAVVTNETEDKEVGERRAREEFDALEGEGYLLLYDGDSGESEEIERNR